MTALVDDLGIWIQLGTIQPNWDFLSFPVLTSTGNNLFRLTTLGDFSKINTFLYFRVVYLTNSGVENVEGKWLRFYPNEQPQIIKLNSDELLLSGNLTRAIQVRKSSKWYGYKIPITDNLYSLTLEEFIPFDEVLQQSAYLPQIQQIVETELAQLKTELTAEIVSQINAQIAQINNS